MRKERLIIVEGKPLIAVDDDRWTGNNYDVTCGRCMFINSNRHCTFRTSNSWDGKPGCNLFNCSYFKPFDDQHINDTKLN